MKRTCVVAVLAVLPVPVACTTTSEVLPAGGIVTTAATQPAQPVDRGETVVVIMAGWLEPYGAMEDIERAVHDALAREVAGQGGAAGVKDPSAGRKPRPGEPRFTLTFCRKGSSALLEGDYDRFLRDEYNAWRKKKQNQTGWRPLDQFVAIGHSSGATGIYNELRKGTFKDGPYMPTYFGLVDMILPVGSRDLTGKVPQDAASGRRTVVAHYHVPGTSPVDGATNVPVRGTDHFAIPRARMVVRGLAKGIAEACMQRITDLLTPGPGHGAGDAPAPGKR